MPEPKIYTAEEWGARKITSSFPRQTAKGIVVHHAVYPNRPPLQGDAEKHAAFKTARSIQESHLQRGWADSGQHFTVSRGGLLMEGRHGSLAGAKHGLVVRGAHAGVAEQNATWFGIELEGRYDQEWAMTDQQWQALIELCAWLSSWGKFDSQQIEGHRHFKPTTACPGLVLEHLVELRGAVHERKAQIASGAG
jgi:hypothetical protein